MGPYGAVLVDTWWYWVIVTWYYVELGYYKALCLYLLKNVEIWLDVTIAGRTDGRTDGQTNKQTNKER